MDAPAALAWLIGEWDGEGRGAYPTVDDFAYREHLSFTRPSPERPVEYTDHTWLVPADTPSHSELGYFRVTADGAVELVVAQPGGRVEVHTGTLSGSRIELASIAVVGTPTANPVTEVHRVMEGRGDDLWYHLDMATPRAPMTFHCEATLHRVA